MPYSRPLAPILLWLTFMLTESIAASGNLSTGTGPCPSWFEPTGQEDVVRKYLDNFSEILARFDCPQPYSVKYKCQQCKEAYMGWVCSSLFKYEWRDPTRNMLRPVKPCRSFCHTVEQKCPFFLPLDKGPVHYAGEPTFLCLDPNIEETGEQLENSAYGPSWCCYEGCSEGLCVRGGCPEPGEEDRGSEGGSAESRRSRGGRSRGQRLFTLTTLALLLLYRTKLLI